MVTVRATDPEHSSFPLWVALGSLGAALWLFFGSTVPALREREELRAAGTELRALRDRYQQVLWHLQPATPEGDDLQSLLVAIDALGWTPEELLRHYPPAGAPGPAEGGDVARR